MPRSAGLALYLASLSLGGRTRTKPGEELASYPSRPDGELAWFGIGPGSRPDALAELARRFCEGRVGCSALLSSEADIMASDEVLAVKTPDDTTREVKRFMDHWRPDVMVLAGDVVYPTAIVEAHHRDIPVCLLDARVPQTMARKLRWAPTAGAAIFDRVAHILTPTEADAEAFRRLRARAERVEAKGRLEEAGAPLPCNRSDHAALATLLSARPVWLAMNVDPQETAMVLAAHDRARRAAHRLLLILCPSDTATGPRLRDEIEERGLRVALRSDGEEPEADVQVYVADVPGENGLWYRLAPITFLGGSLIEGGRGHWPYEPAALGSAILSGRQTRAHREAFARFLAAGAARTVGTGDGLGEAVTDLLSPDRAAEMARRAWEITSAGAEVTDRALEVIASTLDEREPA